jgi:hypothetical protein
MEMGGQFHSPAALSPWIEPAGTHWIGGWVDPRLGLGTVTKIKMEELLIYPSTHLQNLRNVTEILWI